MSAEMNVYVVGPGDIPEEPELHTKYEDYSFHWHSNFTFPTSNNMDKLWAYFHKHENYPEYYLGIAKRVAICKCPTTGKEELFNGERCLSIENPKIYSAVTVTVKIKTRVYTRDFIFLGWAKAPFHEWIMKKGTNLMIEQKFIDKLLPEDKRYLKIN